jgi:PTH1 family peptidyl-tRNA hydrolase
MIVGLGNPGEAYSRTRHNVGFEVIERLAKQAEPASGAGERIAFAERCGARFGVTEWRIGAASLTVGLVQPLTFMNRSGFAVRCLVEELEVPLDDLLVIYDEVALPLGELRLRPKGSPGGHRGMESVVYNLRSSQIARLRCGVGGSPEGVDLADHVLSPFAAQELEQAALLVERAAECAACWASEGCAPAMNRYNGP